MTAAAPHPDPRFPAPWSGPPVGTFTITDGPYSEAKELIGGWALLECASKEEAIEWSKRFLAINGGGEMRLRQVFGAEDVGPTGLWAWTRLTARSRRPGGSSAPASSPAWRGSWATWAWPRTSPTRNERERTLLLERAAAVTPCVS